MAGHVRYFSKDHMSESVFISNVFPDGNKGGAAITSATIQAVQKAVPGARVSLVATQVDRPDFRQSHRFTLDRHPDVRMHMPVVLPGTGPFAGLRAVLRSLPVLFGNPKQSRNPVVREIANSRLIVSKGGYVFVERGTLQRLLRLWVSAFPLMIGARAGVKTAAIGATVGPFTTWHSRALNRWILRKIDLLVPRDEYSYNEAVALGVSPDRIVMLPDVVFSHPGVDAETRDRLLQQYQLHGRRFAAVSLAVGDGNDRFHPGLAEVLRLMLEHGVVDQVQIVIQAFQDLEISQAFVRSMNDSRVQLVDDDLSPEELIALYGASEVVIARRMHTAIFALVAGVPTFACAKYGLKVQGVMRSLGLERYLVAYPEVDVNELLDRITHAVASGEEVRAEVRTAVARARSELEALPRELARVAQTAVSGGVVRGSSAVAAGAAESIRQ